MKRRPPSMLSDFSSSSRRRRALSEEEQALWESVAKQTEPLRKWPRPATARAAVPVDAVKPAARKSPAGAPLAPAEKPRPPPLAPLGRRERSQLARGRMQIDARLDLHGMTQTRAHRALFGFLQRARGEGLTFVLVITGKGKTGAESERGILRRMVPHWLALPEFRSFVVGFEQAHVGHGGDGALYVRIRRSGI